MRIAKVGLDVRREPLLRPFGFKGGAFTEKWICKTSLTSDAGTEASGHGGLAVLWSDRRVFMAHTEVGGNLVMACVLEHALQSARELPSFRTPIDLQEALIEEVHAYAGRIGGVPSPSRTLALNALVSLDNAAWLLRSREEGLQDFDAWIPDTYRPVLSERHEVVTAVPLISYGTPLEQVRRLVDAGAHVLKIKIGAPGSHDEMLEADKRRIEEIHAAVGGRTTPHTADGRIGYYLDANGRYPDTERIRGLLDHATRIGMFDRIVLLEEPFPEGTALDVHDLGVRVAADESLHDLADVAERAEQGYGAVALKPAGKTLSLTLGMAAEAVARGIACFVADSACTPQLLDWNRNVAARLPAFPGLRGGLMETNGAQVYRDWSRMVAEHPHAGARWLEPQDGAFHLTEDFYRTGGGVLT